KAGIGAVKNRLGLHKPDGRTPAERKTALDSAMARAQASVSDPKASIGQVKRSLSDIKNQYRVKVLTLVIDRQGEAEDTVHIEGANSPRVAGAPVVKVRPTAQRQDDGGSDGPVTSTGAEAEISAWSEVDVMKLVAEARGL